jgi:hypothetical protein
LPYEHQTQSGPKEERDERKEQRERMEKRNNHSDFKVTQRN